MKRLEQKEGTGYRKKTAEKHKTIRRHKVEETIKINNHEISQ